MSREEGNVVEALSDLCKRMEIDCLIQIGAEDGYEAYLISDELFCRSIAIDGDIRCVPMHNELEFHHLLIGATDRVVDFYVHDAMGLSSTIQRSDGREKKIRIPQYRLDTFCKMHGGIFPDALIIDTEGTTMDVLIGCGRIIDNVCLVYAECQSSRIRPGVSLFSQVDDWLKQEGFVIREGLPSYEAEVQGNFTWVRA